LGDTKTIRPFALKGHWSIAHEAKPLRAVGLIVKYHLIFIDCRPVKQQLMQQYNSTVVHTGCWVRVCNIQYPSPLPPQKGMEFHEAGGSGRPKNIEKCMKIT